MTQTRKLAAILAADVVGYSRLAGTDEDRTLTRLRALRGDLIDPAIEANRGRVVKQTGDGILVEFRSVVDAVRCATEVQNGMIERNSGLPLERSIEFRIGIHLGDVVEESDGDLMGDGVNIAARLEGIAKPGTIYLSEQAYWQVKARLDLAINDLGKQSLKNIAEPVRVYSIEVGKPAQAKPTEQLKQRSTFVALAMAIVALVLVAAGIWLAMRPARDPEMSAKIPRLSIVVLPFANLSGDPAQDYLADAITEELTTGLSRISGTFVIARSTAFTYKGKPVDVKQVGKDLGVRYVLQGSEQRSGNQVRVHVQLIDAETGAHLWADQFDADRADLLQMQDEIVTRLARALEIKLTAVDAARVQQTRPGNLDAEDLAMRCEVGAYNASMPGSKEFMAALNFCDRALQIDNSNVFALTGMTFNYINPVILAQSRDPQGDIRQADEFVSQALAIDPNSYWAHFAKADVLMGQNRAQEAVVEGDRILSLNPSFINAYFALCAANNFLGRPDRALELADKAIRLSPRDPALRSLYHMKGWAFFMKQQDDQAIEWLRRAEGGDIFTELILAAALALTGQQADAHETLKRYLALNGITSTTIAQLRKQQLSIADNPTWVAYNERLFAGLRKAGMQED
jgi:TolB-like protein/class 3 adenylate cyclase/Tfp pilus assembly protein PilF